MSDSHPDAIEKYDLLLKNGHVIDPANGIDGLYDVAVSGGEITRVEAGIPSENAIQTVDVGDHYVTPGILDIHTHVYKFRANEKSYVESVNPDAHLFASGVTTTVDTGTAGWQHFIDFKENTIDRSAVRVLAFLNIARCGMVDRTSEQNPADMQPRTVASLVEAFPDLIVGIKTAHYWTNQTWDDDHKPWISVDRAVEAGDLSEKPVMVDFWPRPPERPYPDLLLNRLRPGDIHTHVYAQQFPILNSARKVNQFMFAAREKGIRFDLGHGAASFWFRSAVPALRDGFPPDSISTDLHMANVNGSVISMQHTMSKFLNMGMPLAEIIRRSTIEPARIIGRPELGTLAPGAEADIAVFKRLEGKFGFSDCGRARLQGSQKITCHLTLRAGQIVYDPEGMSMPDWEHAPTPYWQTPALQP